MINRNKKRKNVKDSVGHNIESISIEEDLCPECFQEELKMHHNCQISKHSKHEIKQTHSEPYENGKQCDRSSSHNSNHEYHQHIDNSINHDPFCGHENERYQNTQYSLHNQQEYNERFLSNPSNNPRYERVHPNWTKEKCNSGDQYERTVDFEEYSYPHQKHTKTCTFKERSNDISDIQYYPNYSTYNYRPYLPRNRNMLEGYHYQQYSNIPEYFLGPYYTELPYDPYYTNDQNNFYQGTHIEPFKDVFDSKIKDEANYSTNGYIPNHYYTDNMYQTAYEFSPYMQPDADNRKGRYDPNLRYNIYFTEGHQSPNPFHEDYKMQNHQRKERTEPEKLTKNEDSSRGDEFIIDIVEVKKPKH